MLNASRHHSDDDQRERASAHFARAVLNASRHHSDDDDLGEWEKVLW